MPVIEIRRGGPPPEKDFEDGVYPVILVSLDGPKTIYPPDKPQGVDIFEWTFAIDDDSGNRELQDSSSTATSPKSKLYGWIAALTGKAPALDQKFETGDLLGRTALATIGHNEGGWPKITGLMAMPAKMLAERLAKATGAPLKGLPVGQPPAAKPASATASRTAQTLRQAVAAGQPADELPF